MGGGILIGRGTDETNGIGVVEGGVGGGGGSGTEFSGDGNAIEGKFTNPDSTCSIFIEGRGIRGSF